MQSACLPARRPAVLLLSHALSYIWPQRQPLLPLTYNQIRYKNRVMTKFGSSISSNTQRGIEKPKGKIDLKTQKQIMEKPEKREWREGFLGELRDQACEKRLMLFSLTHTHNMHMFTHLYFTSHISIIVLGSFG